MSFSTDSISVQTVTPDKASEFLRSNFLHNRPPRASWVEYLVREMKEGRFISTAEIHIMYRNGEPTMVNGQHTCLAIQKYGKPVRVTVRKTVTNEHGQIAMTYAFGHDTHLRRSWSDQMGAYNLVETTGLSRETLNSLSAALRLIRMNFGAGTDSWARPVGADKKGDVEYKLGLTSAPTELLEIVSDWAPQMKLFDLAVQPCEKFLLKRLRSRAVLAIGLITFRFQPDKAFDFWANTSRPDAISLDSPCWAARRHISDFHANWSKKDQLSRTTRIVARCWNAFYDDESLKVAQLRSGSEKARIVIKGTPYNGKQAANFLPWEAITE